MQRTTLILRYGIGPVHARSGREAARLLDVSRGRVLRLERTGVRTLADLGSRTACEQTEIANITLLAVYDLLADTSLAGGLEEMPAPLEAGVRLAGAASAALEGEGRGAVAGVRESGGAAKERSDKPIEDDDVSSAGPSLSPFDEMKPSVDNPLFVILLAIVVACLASAAAEIRRAIR